MSLAGRVLEGARATASPARASLVYQVRSSMIAPCGVPDHSFYHIIYDCRLHSRVRVEVNPNMRWASKPPDFFLSTRHGGFMFCDFLQRSRAAFKPPNETRVLWDPG
jgi:hypothetical protein